MEFLEKNKFVFIFTFILLLFVSLAGMALYITKTKPKPICKVDLEKVVESSVLSYTVDMNQTGQDTRVPDLILKSIRDDINAQKYGCSAIFIKGSVLSIDGGRDITDEVIANVKKK